MVRKVECREKNKTKQFPRKGQELLSIRVGNIKFNVTSLGRLPDQPLG